MKNKLVLAFLMIFFFISLFTKEAYATEAALSCTPATGTYRVGDTFVVDFILNTRNFPTYGAVIETTFDPSVIEAMSSQITPVTSVTTWGQPASNSVDNTLGKISVNFPNTQPAYTGNTTIGQLTFRAKATGQAQLNYTFFQQYDDTSPSVAKVWGKKDGVNLSNILTDVYNCIYLVEAAPTQAPNPTSPPQATSPPRPTVTALPQTGAVENTIIFTVFALILLSSGILLPKFISNKE